MVQKSHQFHVLVHHLLVALSVAAIVHVLEHYRALNWLDSLMLRIASHASAGSGDSTLPADMPVVLQIGDLLYEREFAQASPLNRGKLGTLIGELANKGPRTLVVDIDLSPGLRGAGCPNTDQPAARGTEAEGQGPHVPLATDSPCSEDQIALNQLLAKLGNTPNMRLILATPVPVAAPELWREKAKWMASLCGNAPPARGVQFAFVHTPLSQHEVLRFETRFPSLGPYAAWMERAQPTRSKLPCEYVRTNPDSAVFLQRQTNPEALLDAEDFRGQRPFNARFFGMLEYQTKTIGLLQAVADLEAIDKKLPLSGRTVFFGGGYGSHDEFATAFGTQNGVALHAAAYYSMLHGVSKPKDWAAFAIDILIGIAMGYLFHASWSRYNRAAALAPLEAGAPAHWPSYFRARAWLMANFALMLGLVVLLAYLSGWLLRSDLWVNPGPVIIGVFIKTILASRAHIRHAQVDAEHSEAHALRPHHSLVQWVDFMLFLPFVIWAGLLLLFGH